MQNPYESPSSVATTSTELGRPFGVAVLAVLTGILGLGLLALFVFLALSWQEHNEYFLRRRLAPSIFWFGGGVGVVMPFVASIGMWKGTKWGWWVYCSGLVMFVSQYVVLLAVVNLSQGPPSVSILVSPDSLKYVMRGIILALVLAYWLRTRVRRHFRVEKTSRIKAVVLAGACSIGSTLIITAVLQFLFMYRMR